MAPTLCAQCKHELQRDALDHPPPWCPKCGADVKSAPAGARPTSPASPAPRAATPEASTPDPTPAFAQAASPATESFRAAIVRIAGSRPDRPQAVYPSRHTGLYVVVALFVAAAAVAGLLLL